MQMYIVQNRFNFQLPGSCKTTNTYAGNIIFYKVIIANQSDYIKDIHGSLSNGIKITLCA